MTIKHTMMCTLSVSVLLMHGCGRGTDEAESAAPAAESAEAVAVAQQPLELGAGYDEVLTDDPAIVSEISQPPSVQLDVDGSTQELFALLDTLEHDGRFADAWQAARDYRTENPEAPDIAAVDQRIERLNRMRREAPDVQYALRQLSDPNPTVRDIVRQQLMRGGETARILLRKAVREEPLNVSRSATAILQHMRAEDSFEDIFKRMTAIDEPTDAVTFMNACIHLIDLQDIDALRPVAAWLKNAGSSEFIPLARAVHERLNELPESAQVASLRSDVNHYLTGLLEQGEDRETLEAGLAAALLSGDEEAVQQFSELGLLFLLHEQFLIGNDSAAGGYSVSGVGGQSPLIPGATNRWSASSGACRIREKGLTHPLVPAAGGSLGHDRGGGGYTGAHRDLDTQLGAGPEPFTVWFASLHMVSGFQNFGNRSHWEYDLGGETIRWGIYEQSLHAFGETLGEAEAGRTYLFVTKLEKNHSGRNDRWSVWVFPPAEPVEGGLGEPSASGEADFWKDGESISNINLNLQGDSRHDQMGYIDEIQIAERYLDLGLSL